MSGTLVAGAGVAGTAAALALLRRGATVTVVDRASTPALARLAAAGARVVVADEPPADLLDGVSDVVVSPGFAPHHPLAARAVAAGLDVYSEPELAWRLRGDRKSTRLNSSHGSISYAVFWLKKRKESCDCCGGRYELRSGGGGRGRSGV